MDVKRFIHLADQIHGGKYDYGQVEYVSDETKVLIYCNECGRYYQTKAKYHIAGSGCGHKYRSNQCGGISGAYDQFLDRCRELYGNDYFYAQASYGGPDSIVTVKCKKHGEFRCSARKLMHGSGCSECACASEKRKFLDDAAARHHGKYDYVLVNYVDKYTKVNVICPKHDVFQVTPHKHITGEGCPECEKMK